MFKYISEELKNNLREGQRIEINIKDELDSIKTDPKILRNILINLFSNASKYSGINTTIHVSASKNKNDLIIQVRDEGIGIPEEDQRHLFDRFFRAGNVSNIQGTGLGLHIVKRYAELLDGTISFESQQNIGSTFTFQFPNLY